MDTKEIKTFNQIIENFVSKPETFVLFRGENKINKGGLHFTLDNKWAENFGNIIIKGTLPANSKIKLITQKDMQDAFNNGIPSENLLWNYFFEKGYDAIIGTDARNSQKIDIIVNKKHLTNFKSILE